MAYPLPVVWTQRIHDLYITASVIEPKDVVVQIEPLSVSIKCSTTGEDGLVKHYEFFIELFSRVEADVSQYIVLTRGIRLKLRKACGPTTRTAFWPRLTREKVKLAHVTVDWDTWKDEDDLLNEDDEAAQGTAFSEAMGFRMSNGTTISGGGDPNVIAQLQKQFLDEQKAAADQS